MKRRTKKIEVFELHPDELLLDVHNLPAFDKQQFEGRVERAIPKRSIKGILICALVVIGIFAIRLFYLQVIRHDFYAQKSTSNSIETAPIFADRGVIYDRHNTELAWNTLDEAAGGTVRKYTHLEGFANFLGYVSYPAKDSNGKFWQARTIGKDGIEKEYDDELAGKNGTRIAEVAVDGTVISGGLIEKPEQGTNVVLSIDSRMQSSLFDGIKALAVRSGFVGGAGVIMDVHTGEIVAMTSYPEYNPQVLADGSDVALIRSYMNSPARPFLNRATEGLYTPGSIIKPFLAIAALHEGIITPYKQILSTKEMKVPNPYKPGTFSIFKDNAAHGLVDMRHAIAVSSNIYFYQIGGGFGTQKGLGIANIEKYSKMFGIGQKTGIDLAGELGGTVPSIAWKAKHFPKDPWRLGDTYNTSIGQYGYQVTPLEMVRAMGGIATKGTLVTPTLIRHPENKPINPVTLPFTPDEYKVVQEGLLLDVTEGTARALLIDGFPAAAKTGTAQIKNNTRVNSWVLGFFPYDKPRFAFVVLMEDGPKITAGAVHAFRPVLDFIHANPELLTQ